MVKFRKIWVNFALARFFRMTSAWRHRVGSRLDDISMMSSGDMAAYEWSMGITEVADRSDPWRARRRCDGDMAWRGRDVEVTLAWRGKRETTSGKWFYIRPLCIRSRFCQRSARSYNIKTRVPAHTSADVKFWDVKAGRRGHSEMAESRRMGKPRSDDWREAE